MSTAARRQSARLPRQQRVADIMETARAVFCEKGYNDALVAEIAARLGIVEGTVYRYFVGKRDLLIKVLEQWYQEILADYDHQLKGMRGTWNRLRFMIWRHLKVIHDDPAMCRLIFNELRPTREYPTTAVFDLNRRYTQRILAIIEEGMAAGEFRNDVPLRIVRDMIYGGIEHHTWAFLRSDADFSPDAAADAMTDLIFRGLARSPEIRSGPTLISTPMDKAVRRLEDVTRRLEAALEVPGAKR